MEQICLNGLPEIVGGIVTTVVMVASALANVFDKKTVVGKLINLLAINLTVEKK